MQEYINALNYKKNGLYKKYLDEIIKSEKRNFSLAFYELATLYLYPNDIVEHDKNKAINYFNYCINNISENDIIIANNIGVDIRDLTSDLYSDDIDEICEKLTNSVL